jgi:hypothetical protein
MVQSNPIFDAVPGGASSAIIGSTVIVLPLGRVTVSRWGNR